MVFRPPPKLLTIFVRSTNHIFNMKTHLQSFFLSFLSFLPSFFSPSPFFPSFLLSFPPSFFPFFFPSFSPFLPSFSFLCLKTCDFFSSTLSEFVVSEVGMGIGVGCGKPHCSYCSLPPTTNSEKVLEKMTMF